MRLPRFLAGSLVFSSLCALPICARAQTIDTQAGNAFSDGGAASNLMCLATASGDKKLAGMIIRGPDPKQDIYKPRIAYFVDQSEWDKFVQLWSRARTLKAPARTKPEDLVVLDELVLTRIPDRSHKAQAPEPLKPTNRFGSPDAAVKHFDDSRAQTIAFLEKTPDLRAHATDSPMGKQLDAYEWVLFIAAHSDRHTKQILEVKADPNFPKRTAGF